MAGWSEDEYSFYTRYVSKIINFLLFSWHRRVVHALARLGKVPVGKPVRYRKVNAMSLLSPFL
jgi:hypothetical protein